MDVNTSNPDGTTSAPNKTNIILHPNTVLLSNTTYTLTVSKDKKLLDNIGLAVPEQIFTFTTAPAAIVITPTYTTHVSQGESFVITATYGGRGSSILNFTNTIANNNITYSSDHGVTYKSSASCTVSDQIQECSIIVNVAPGTTEGDYMTSIIASNGADLSVDYVNFTVLSKSNITLTTIPIAPISVGQGGSYSIKANYSAGTDNLSTHVSFANENSSNNNNITYSPSYCDFSPNQSPASCTVTVNVAANTPLNEYKTNVVPTNGVLGATDIDFHVTLAPITISTYPVSPINIAQGKSFTLTATSNSGSSAVVSFKNADVSNDNKIIYTPTSCSVSSGQPCSVTAKIAPTTLPGNYVTNVSTNNGIGLSASTIPFTVAFSGFSSPYGITINSAGTAAFITNLANNSVTLCNVGTSGGLSGCRNSGASGLIAPSAITIHPSGSFVYVTNAGSTSVTKCNVNNDGLSGCTNSGAGLNVAPAAIAINPTGTIAYFTNFGNSVTHCSINLDGSMSPSCATNSTYQDNDKLSAITISSNGSTVYMTNSYYNSVETCQIESGVGNLFYCSFAIFGLIDTPSGIALQNSGTQLNSGSIAYVTSVAGNKVSQISISGQNVTNEVTINGGPSSIALTPTNGFAFITNSQDNVVNQCNISANDGSLSNCIPTGQ